MSLLGGKIAAVIFDMDGLMLDTERISRDAWFRTFAEMGYTLTTSDYMRVIGRNRYDTEVIMRQIYGPDFPLDAIYARSKAHYAAEIARDLPIKPGLLPLLHWLEQQHIPKAVASSTERAGVEYKLARAGILQHFPILVGGDEVTRGKPEPDIFLLAAAKLQINPLQCIALEDSEPGICAAHAAGMIPFMVPDLKAPSDEIRKLAYQVFDSLHAVKQFLE